MPFKWTATDTPPPLTFLKRDVTCFLDHFMQHHKTSCFEQCHPSRLKQTDVEEKMCVGNQGASLCVLLHLGYQNGSQPLLLFAECVFVCFGITMSVLSPDDSIINWFNKGSTGACGGLTLVSAASVQHCSLQRCEWFISRGDPTCTQNRTCLLKGVNSIAIKISISFLFFLPYDVIVRSAVQCSTMFLLYVAML